MPRLRAILAVCLLILLLSVGATALLSNVQRLHGEVTLDRGVQARRAVLEAVPRPAHRVSLPVNVPVAHDDPIDGGARAAEPRVVYGPAPHYPIRALRAKRQGLVRVRVLLDGGGRVIDATVAHSSGDPELDRAALRAVGRWTFDMPPGARRQTVLPIRFHIDTPSP